MVGRQGQARIFMSVDDNRRTTETRCRWDRGRAARWRRRGAGRMGGPAGRWEAGGRQNGGPAGRWEAGGRQMGGHAGRRAALQAVTGLGGKTLPVTTVILIAFFAI